MISIARRFLFVHIPKTAGNAIQSALLPYSEDEIECTAPHQDGIERFAIRSPSANITKHSPLAVYARELPAEVFDGLFKFTCVRNPWDRCISHFFSPHRGEVDWSPAAFQRFVEEEVRPSDFYLALAEDREAGQSFARLDAVIRFERLETDFAEVVRTLGVGVTRLPRLNASRRQDYRAYYDRDELIRLVARKFEPEIDYFGYAFAA